MLKLLKRASASITGSLLPDSTRLGLYPDSTSGQWYSVDYLGNKTPLVNGVTSVAALTGAIPQGNSVVASNGSLETAVPITAVTGTTSRTYNATTDRNKMFLRSNAGTAMTDTLPSPATAGNGYAVTIYNIDSTATLTVSTPSGVIGNGGTSTFALLPSRRTQFVCDGTNWYFLSNNNNLLKVSGTVAANDVVLFSDTTGVTVKSGGALGTAAFTSASAYDAAGAAAAAQAASVPTSRTVSTTAPLTGGGALSANLTLGINAATSSAAGSMSATDKAFINAFANATVILVTANSYSNLKCDGATDDAAALNALYSAAPDHSTLMWPPGTMILSTTVSIPAGKHFQHKGSGNQKTFWNITSGTVDMVSVGDWQNTFDGISFQTQSFTIAGNQAITGAAQTLNISNPTALLPNSGSCTIPTCTGTGTLPVWVVFNYTSRTSTTITGTAASTGGGFSGIPFGGAAVAGTAYFRTGGYFINAGTNTDIFITGCDFSGGYNGTLLNGTLCSIRDSQFSNMINFDMQFNGTNVNSIIDNVTCDGSPPAVSHIEVNQCGSLLITDCDIIRANTNLRLNPTSPNGCFGVYSVNTYYDTATASTGIANSGNGVLLQGTGNIQRIKFTNCWMSSASHDGLWSNSTASTLPTDVQLIGCNIYSNGANGVDWAAGQDLMVNNSQIAGNVTAGINLAAAAGSVTKALLFNNRIGPAGGIGANGTGIIAAAGAYGAVQIRGNDAIGNTTASFTLGAITVANAAQYAVTDNPGYNPHGTVATPTFPTSTTVVTNTTGLRVVAYVKAGTTAPTVITHNGVANSTVLPAASSLFTIVLSPGDTIAFTYTVALTWVWVGD